MPIPSFTEMRHRNALSIVSLLREKGELSRIELAGLANLSPGTISSIVEGLISTGILTETGSRRAIQKGRPSIGITFDPMARLFPGISFDDAIARMVLCNLDGKIIDECTIEYASITSPNLLVKQLVRLLQGITNKLDTDLNRIGTVGISVPGPLHIARKRKILIGNTSSISLEMVLLQLKKQLGRSIIIDSNVNTAALAESICGVAKGATSALLIRSGYEVRSALVIEGQLFLGQLGLAGGVGHIPLINNTKECFCGNTGCINTIASAKALIDKCKSSGVNKVKVMQDVVSGAVTGIPICREAISDAGSAIGYAVAIMMNSIAPSAIVVTGKLLGAHDLFTKPLYTAIKQYAVKENLSACKIVLSKLQHNAEPMGAALKALSTDPWLTLSAK